MKTMSYDQFFSEYEASSQQKKRAAYIDSYARPSGKVRFFICHREIEDVPEVFSETFLAVHPDNSGKVYIFPNWYLRTMGLEIIAGFIDEEAQ